MRMEIAEMEMKVELLPHLLALQHWCWLVPQDLESSATLWHQQSRLAEVQEDHGGSRTLWNLH
jgi:hypothetical protein